MAGIDEHDDCEVEAQSGCGQDGTCDGAGACRLYGVQTPCGPTSCSPFNELVGEHCDGLGACLGGTPVGCSPGVCRSGVCELACGSDRECAPGAWCDLQSGQCSAANRAPTAVLTGGTQAISNVPLVLSGEDSFDPDGDSLTYDFVQVVGPQAELQTTPMPEIMSATMPTVDASTTLVFELTVSDGQAQSEPASLFVELAPPDVPGWVTCLDCNAAAGGWDQSVAPCVCCAGAADVRSKRPRLPTSCRQPASERSHRGRARAPVAQGASPARSPAAVPESSRSAKGTIRPTEPAAPSKPGLRPSKGRGRHSARRRAPP